MNAALPLAAVGRLHDRPRRNPRCAVVTRQSTLARRAQQRQRRTLTAARYSRSPGVRFVPRIVDRDPPGLDGVRPRWIGREPAGVRGARRDRLVAGPVVGEERRNAAPRASVRRRESCRGVLRRLASWLRSRSARADRRRRDLRSSPAESIGPQHRPLRARITAGRSRYLLQPPGRAGDGCCRGSRQSRARREATRRPVLARPRAGGAVDAALPPRLGIDLPVVRDRARERTATACGAGSVACAEDRRQGVRHDSGNRDGRGLRYDPASGSKGLGGTSEDPGGGVLPVSAGDSCGGPRGVPPRAHYTPGST